MKNLRLVEEQRHDMDARVDGENFAKTAQHGPADGFVTRPRSTQAEKGHVVDSTSHGGADRPGKQQRAQDEHATELREDFEGERVPSKGGVEEAVAVEDGRAGRGVDEFEQGRARVLGGQGGGLVQALGGDEAESGYEGD